MTSFSFFAGQCPQLCGLLANSFERVSLPAALRDLWQRSLDVPAQKVGLANRGIADEHDLRVTLVLADELPPPWSVACQSQRDKAEVMISKRELSRHICRSTNRETHNKVRERRTAQEDRRRGR